MKPKYLEFCGINSFSEAAKIDFEKLLRGGIFGIFGDTGSGKTTVLDCIVFALYGRMERARSGVNAEIINYNCDKAYVIFEFETREDDGRKIYRVKREIRRKNSAQKVELILLNGDRQISLGDGKVSSVNAQIQKIVGLTFDDFKKCIALPQGEFAQFVKAEKSERLKLIARLFDLEDYGDQLNARLREKYLYFSDRVLKRQGRLEEFTNYSNDFVVELKRKWEDQVGQIDSVNSAYALERECFENLKSTFEKGLQVKQINQKLTELLARESEITVKRAAVARYSAAREAGKINSEREKLRIKARKIREELEALNLKKDRIETALSAFRRNAEIQNWENVILTLHNQLARAESAESDYKLLQNKLQEKNNLKADYKKYNEQLQSAENNLLNTANRKAEAKARQSALQEAGEPEYILRENLDGALLREEYNLSLVYFREKYDCLRERFENDSDLYREVEKEISERVVHYENLLQKAEGEMGVDAMIAAFKLRREQQNEILQILHNTELKEREEAQSKKEAQEKLDYLIQQGKKLAAEADDLQKKLSVVLCGESDYDVFVGDLRRRLRQAETERKNQSELLEKYRNDLAGYDAQLQGNQATLQVLEESERELREKFDAALQDGGFDGWEQVKHFLEKYPDIQKTETEIKRFDEEKLSLQAGKSALSEGVVFISEEELKTASEQYEAIVARREKLLTDIRLCEKEYSEALDKLNDKKIIEKELHFYQSKLDIVEKLRELLKGNKFMEFVASEYLSEISIAASETLLKLTNGRYFIRYRQGFYVGDNFNGGELRAVFTLSGGETFLLSLSLALALSAAIYAKSLRPIEFFFLDEGFGTLDEKLIDTVMDSLEKLKNTHFSIGLISHVEELKHRIDHKITVLGAAEGASSKIQINY